MKYQRLKHVHAVKAKLSDGTVKTYYRHRITGKRINADPSDFPAFYEAWKLAGEPEGGTKGTFGWLREKYQKSPAYTDLADRTRADYEKGLDEAVKKFGRIPLSMMEDSRIRKKILEWRGKWEKTPRTADKHLQALSACLGWGVAEGHLAYNHCTGLRKLYKGGQRADVIWTAQDIEKFMSAAPISMKRAMMVALYTGQRQGDILKLTRGNIDGDFIRLRQAKTGKRVAVPIFPQLRPWLENLPDGSMMIVPTTHGKAYSLNGFRSGWRKVCDKAGIEGLRFHDLRGTAYTLLRDAGCTPEELNAWIGTKLEHVYAKQNDALSLSALRKVTGTKV